MNSLHKKVIQHAQHCHQIAEKKLKQSFPIPSFRFDIRGQAAGMANLTKWEIRLNPILLAENEAEFFREVIPHELSHLIVHHIFGRVRPHGREWQNIMRLVFEVEPETRHNYDTSSLPGQSFRYQCSCQTFDLTIRRHNKVQRKQATYQCQTCHQPLVWLGE